MYVCVWLFLTVSEQVMYAGAWLIEEFAELLIPYHLSLIPYPSSLIPHPLSLIT